MRITPKTEKELNQGDLLNPGEYDYEVYRAEDKTSKAGNEMIQLSLKVFTGDGDKFVFINDFLLDSIPHKLRHFCAANGLLGVYESGTLQARDCLGKAGLVNIGIKKGTGNYADQNTVKDYVVDEAGDSDQPATKQSNDPFADDFVP
jgi:hypothetical protein